MFTLDQLREFTQKIDDYINNSPNQDEAIKKVLPSLEEGFSSIFQKDELSNTSKRWYTFRIGEDYYALTFKYLSTGNLRISCVTYFTENVEAGSGLNLTNWGVEVPTHEFIYNHCNPEGVLMLEKILFEEIV